MNTCIRIESAETPDHIISLSIIDCITCEKQPNNPTTPKPIQTV